MKWLVHKIYNSRRGIGSVEVVVGVSITALVLVFTTHTIVRFLNVGRDVLDKTEALYLAEEGLEMVRYIRDEKWAHITNLTEGTTYYLNVTGSDIATSTTPEVIDAYTRSFVVTEVLRDGADDVVASGSVDPGSRYVTATVSWGTPTTSVSLTTMLSNISNP